MGQLLGNAPVHVFKVCPANRDLFFIFRLNGRFKLDVEGRTVFICCEGCRSGMVDEPEKYFAILDDYLSGKVKVEESSDDGAANQSGGNEELPQMQLPQMELPQMDLPQMELPKQ